MIKHELDFLSIAIPGLGLGMMCVFFCFGMTWEDAF